MSSSLPLTSDPSMLVNIPIMTGDGGIILAEDGIGVINGSPSKSNDQAVNDNRLDVEDVNVNEEEETDVYQMLSAGDGQFIQDNTTLQSLLSTGCQVVTQPNGMQVVVLPATTQDMVGLQLDMGLQIVPNKYLGIIPIQQALQHTKFENVEGIDVSEFTMVNSDTNLATIVVPSSIAPSEPPPGCPAWAARLQKCEKIGDSYRGYVENEANLDLILTLHKQQTNSFWGTRQSPSSAKSSTRLMWKSQYVPFDGIPFVNSGSRAVVMECQYGPRRKGTGKKSHCPVHNNRGFRQTCPARIYVKKVRKFPSYAVNLDMDKKNVRVSMDKAFQELKDSWTNVWGEERYYVQLPTEAAHDYHDDSSPVAVANQEQETVTSDTEAGKCQSVRIHPKVLEKIREMVACGETKLYAIRKQLRKFVVRDLFRGSRHAPERHDLTVFPTVNDLKNHIHQALTDIQDGTLLRISPATPSVIEMNTDSQGKDDDDDSQKPETVKSELGLWPRSVMPETVTVTLTQNPDENGQHMISRIETHLSDGTTQVSTTLTPETAQLLARLQPSLFRASGLQMNGSPMSSSVDLLAEEGSETPGVLSPQVLPDLEISPLVEARHSLPSGISPYNPTPLRNIVDIEGNVHNLSAIISDVGSSGTTSIIKSEPPSASADVIHLNPQSSSHSLSSLVDSSGTLASHCHLSALASSHPISMINTVDSVHMSQMVSPGGTAHLSIIPNTDNPSLVHPGEAVVMNEGHHSAIGLVGEEATAQFEDHCGVHGIAKTIGCEEDGSEPTLESDKITLHMTTDQELGITRLENKVSIL